MTTTQRQTMHADMVQRIEDACVLALFRTKAQLEKARADSDELACLFLKDKGKRLVKMLAPSR